MTNKRTTKRALLFSVLSMLLCVTMLMGTTYAWFTDSVSSTNNIIKSGNLDVELEYLKDGKWVAVGEDTNVFSNQLWEPGHTEVVYLKVSNVGSLALKYNLGVNIAKEIEGTNVKGEAFKLSDYIFYDAFDVNGETNAFADRAAAMKDTTETIKISNGYAKVGALYAANNIPAAGGVSEEYVALVVYMPETVGNEANYKTGTTAPEIHLGINLAATQYSFEVDSFDKYYDGEAFIPVADVDLLGAGPETVTWGIGGAAEEIELDVKYSFKPTEKEDAAAASGYRYWHADFVVKADKDVPANSMALAGYYNEWCQYNNDNWVALTSPEIIKAGTEIRLVQSMGNGGISVNYEELCKYGSDGIGFLCGAADLTGENAGTTLTVELRLYKTTKYPGATGGTANDETGPDDYIVIGTYSYTFPSSRVNTLADLQKALDEAKDGDVIELGSHIEGNVTATQKPGVKVTLNGNNKNFAGVITVDGKSGTYLTAGLTIKNLNFIAPSLEGSDACIRLGKSGDNNTRYTCNVTVEGCTFDVPGAVGVKSYTGGDKNLTITNCVATAKAHSLVQAKGIDGILIEKCTVNSKNGMNFNNSTNVTVDECTVDVKGYAVRFGEGSSANGAAETYTVKNSTLKSACAESDDAVIVLRGSADLATLTIVNTTLTGTRDILNPAGATVNK